MSDPRPYPGRPECDPRAICSQTPDHGTVNWYAAVHVPPGVREKPCPAIPVDWHTTLDAARCESASAISRHGDRRPDG